MVNKKAVKVQEKIVTILNNLDIVYKVEDYNYKEKKLEIIFTLSEKDKNNIISFYKKNKELYKDKTINTEIDLMEIENIYVMFHGENMYFGKTEYDYTAVSIASLFLVEIYLDKVYERIIFNLNK